MLSGFLLEVLIMFTVYQNGEFQGVIGALHLTVKESKWFICRNTKHFIHYRPVGILNPEWRKQLEALGFEIRKERNFDVSRLPSGY